METNVIQDRQLMLSIREEKANVFIHGMGVCFGLVAVPILLVLAFQTGNTYTIVSSAIYGICFLAVFISSTLFHNCCEGKRKDLYHLLDYLSIYLLIAGTYTPFISNFMQNDSGIWLLGTVWTCAVGGCVLRIFYPNQFRVLSVMSYLLIGFMFLFQSKAFFANMPGTIAQLVVIGSILYTVGVIFYVWRKWMYHHAVWHFFVLVAGICHFMAVVLTISQHDQFELAVSEQLGGSFNYLLKFFNLPGSSPLF